MGVNIGGTTAATPSRTSAAGAAVVVMGASALSAVLGFGREVLAAHYYGTRAEMDAFLNASTIPTVLLEIFSAALVAALVPTFSEYVTAGREDEVRRLGSTLFNVLLLVMTALAALGWLLAPLLVPVVAHGFSPPEQQLAVRIVRWLMPGVVAMSLSGVCAAILNANHRFLASALIWVATNVVTIAVVIALHRELGIFALVLGTVLGLFAQVAIQLPPLLRHGLYRFEVDLRHPGIATSWRLLIPVVIGSSAAQLNIAFDRYFASTLPVGSTAALDYTSKLAFLPTLIVAGAIATVLFPLVAGQFARVDAAAVRQSTSLALRMVGFVVVPCAAGLSALAYPIVQTLFERGAFGPSSTALCASLVPFACLPLIATSYTLVLGRACYACKGVRAAVIGSSSAVAINIVLSVTWLPVLGARGLLLANGVAGMLLCAFLIALLWRLIGGFDWKPMLFGLLRITLAALAMGAVVHVLALGYVPAAGFSSRAVHLAGLIGAAALLFAGSARLLGVVELTLAFRAVARRLGRPPVIGVVRAADTTV